ncbi:MAG: hypothetical protein WC471_03950 [Candidatus Woesearchaeota archaeon]
MDLRNKVLSAFAALTLNGCGIEYVDPFSPPSADLGLNMNKPAINEVAEGLGRKLYISADEMPMDDKINKIISSYMKKDKKQY